MITFAIILWTVNLPLISEGRIHRQLDTPSSNAPEITLDAFDAFVRNRSAQVLVVTGPPGSSNTISRYFLHQSNLVTACIDAPAIVFQPALSLHSDLLIVDATLWSHPTVIHAYRALLDAASMKPLWAVVLIVATSHVASLQIHDASAPILWIDWQEGRWFCRSRRVTHRPV